MKYSIILPYFGRRGLYNTLVSYAHHYRGRDDYEVIIVEDYKNRGKEHTELLRTIRAHKGHVPIRHIRVGAAFKHYYNSAPLINLGVKEAQGQFIVLTSPECFHKTDVLCGFDRVLDHDPDAYVIAAVANGDLAGTLHKNVSEFAEFTYTLIRWYQHSVHCDRRLHFCSAMSKETFNKIGGMDEGFAFGFWCDDEDFRETAIQRGIRFVVRDDIVVIHQRHALASAGIRDKLIDINQAYEKKKIGYLRHPHPRDSK